jgi:hypothetical protein
VAHCGDHNRDPWSLTDAAEIWMTFIVAIYGETR